MNEFDGRLNVRKLIDFGRKNCVLCKCPRNAHDVAQKESVNVHDRLGLGGLGGSDTGTKSGDIDDRHQTMVMAHIQPARPSSNDVYSWIPAGIQSQQVTYFIHSFLPFHVYVHASISPLLLDYLTIFSFRL